MKSMLRNPRAIVPVLAVLLTVFGALRFMHTYEKKSFEVRQGESPAARKNPFLAAQGYLQALGKKVISNEGMALLSHLPAAGEAILLPHMPAGMSQHLAANLLSWVEEGGHLLLVPNGSIGNHAGADDLLKKIGVALDQGENQVRDCPSRKKKKAASRTAPMNGHKGKKTQGEFVQETTRGSAFGDHPYDPLIDLDIDNFPIHLKYFNSTLLKDVSAKAAYRIDGTFRKAYREKRDRKAISHDPLVQRHGAWLLQYNIGAGKVTVMSEMGLFHNKSIGEYDHAFFLSWLLRDREKIWLLYALGANSLWVILWKQLPYFWISFAVSILLILWRMQKRSGGLLRPPLDKRRNILAHIEATGAYSWRMNKAAAMIAENRKTILHRLARHQLGLRQDQPGEKIGLSKLAAKTGMTEQELLVAFRSNVANEQNLIQTSQALQKIEKLIHRWEK